MVTIKEFVNRHQVLLETCTVCICPEGIIEREPDEMWQGLMWNIPEELIDLPYAMFHVTKKTDPEEHVVQITFEVPEEDLHAALKDLVAESKTFCFAARCTNRRLRSDANMALNEIDRMDGRDNY